MKIREVIEKTGLTDRAIRLYIDEGLAAPSIEESYSGRKSIEFSPSDVERLNNVAMLRKAGFSIADIKSIVDDKSTSKSIIEKFIGQTEENIKHESEIVEKLKSISFDEDVTIETICESLSATVEENEVPSEDLKLSTIEKVKKFISILLASAHILYALYKFIFNALFIFDFRFPKIDHSEFFSFFLYSGWLIIAVMMAVVLRMSMNKNFIKRVRGRISVILSFSFLGNIFLTIATFVLVFGSVFPFCSRTTNPKNYMILDRSVEEYMKTDYFNSYYETVFDVFPEQIPASACVGKYSSNYPDSTKYFYEYVACGDGHYGTSDIFAEWILSADEYKKAKNDLPEIRRTVQKGDWTMVYYTYDVHFSKNNFKKSESEKRYEESKDEFKINEWATEEYYVSYSFLICAYNDKQQKIRYIASERCSHERLKEAPYYISLDWE